MKTIFGIIIVVVLGFVVWKAVQTKPNAGVQQATVSDSATQETGPVAQAQVVDNGKVTVAFTGFGPGKQHTGSFTSVSSNLVPSATAGMTGTIRVATASLTSDNEKLTGHLKTADFFDVAKYPEATFELTRFDSAAGKATGIFTIKGVAKTLTFPVQTVRAADGKTATAYASTFTLNLKDFGISQTFANETIELRITAPVK